MLVERQTRAVTSDSRPDPGATTGAATTREIAGTLDRTTVVFTVLFGVASLLKALTHEIWQDEAQAWLIARASSDPIDLVANLRGEGHPMLWHLVLWPVTRLTADPFAMQVVSAVLVTIASHLVVRRAPLPRAVAMGLMLGALPFFVYNTIARTYALELALFAYAGSLCLRRPRPARVIAVALGLACFTSLYAVVVAGACWAALLLDERIDGGTWSALKRWVLPSAGLAVAAFAASAQALAPDSSYKDQVITDVAAGKVHGGPRAVFEVFFAGLEWVAYDVVTALQGNALLFAGIVALLFSAVTLAILDRPALVLGWFVASGAVIAALAFTGLSAPHHRGQLFFAFVFGVFLRARSAPWPDRGPTRPIRRIADRAPRHVGAAVVGACILAGATLGLAVSYRDIREPFVPWTEAARLLRTQGLADAPLVVTEPGRTSPILAHLDRTAWMAWSWTEGDFAEWKTRTQRSDAEVIAGSRRVAATAGRAAVLITDAPLDVVPSDVTLLARIDTGFRTQRDDSDRDVAYLYLVPSSTDIADGAEGVEVEGVVGR